MAKSRKCILTLKNSQPTEKTLEQDMQPTECNRIGSLLLKCQLLNYLLQSSIEEVSRP